VGEPDGDRGRSGAGPPRFLGCHSFEGPLHHAQAAGLLGASWRSPRPRAGPVSSNQITDQVAQGRLLGAARPSCRRPAGSSAPDGNRLAAGLEYPGPAQRQQGQAVILRTSSTRLRKIRARQRPEAFPQSQLEPTAGSLSRLAAASGICLLLQCTGLCALR